MPSRINQVSSDRDVSGRSVSSASTKNSIITKGGREFLGDPTLVYPLPVDLAETHRQILSTLLMTRLYGGPLMTPEFSRKPPRRVLELGCNTGLWSLLCHRHFQQLGHKVSFVGVDIRSPLPREPNDQEFDMDWQFVQHDLRQAPWPLKTGSFDLVMAKDMIFVFTSTQYQMCTVEYVRLLKPGGILEVWECDYTVRSLRPEARHILQKPNGHLDSGLGVYPVEISTPLGPAVNSYLAEYNTWVTKAFSKLDMTPIPCSIIESGLTGLIVKEADAWEVQRSRRLAVPLSEIKWEQQGGQPMVLDAEPAAIRKTALECVVRLIEAFEPILREANGMRNQEDWDSWFNKARKNLMQDRGTSFGECLEFGVWTARKKD